MAFSVKKYMQQVTASMNGAEAVAYLCRKGLLNYNAVRNEAIRDYYHSLRTPDRLTAKIATADVFCVSVDMVHKILYSARYKLPPQD